MVASSTTMLVILCLLLVPSFSSSACSLVELTTLPLDTEVTPRDRLQLYLLLMPFVLCQYLNVTVEVRRKMCSLLNVEVMHERISSCSLLSLPSPFLFVSLLLPLPSDSCQFVGVKEQWSILLLSNCGCCKQPARGTEQIWYGVQSCEARRVWAVMRVDSEYERAREWVSEWISLHVRTNQCSRQFDWREESRKYSWVRSCGGWVSGWGSERGSSGAVYNYIVVCRMFV